MFTSSAMEGFTFPGMMLDPGCTAGRTISASPGRGPEASTGGPLPTWPRSTPKVAGPPGVDGRGDRPGGAGARARGKQPQVARDLAEIHGVGPQRAREGGGVAERLHELHAVPALPQVEAGELAQVAHHEPRVLGLGVEPGADGGAADAEVAQ